MKIYVNKELKSIRNSTILVGTYYIFIWNEEHPHWSKVEADTSDSLRNCIILNTSPHIEQYIDCKLLSLSSFREALKNRAIVILNES
jgi:hypothetical protein